MALGSYLASLNMSPAVNARLQTIYNTPNGDAPSDDLGPPSAETMAGYGVSPASIAVAQNANAPRDDTSMTSPARQPGWTPEVDDKRTKDAREAAEARDLVPAPGNQPGQDVAAHESPASPGRYVPAHWQPGTRTEAIRYGMNPEALGPAQSAHESATGHGIAAGEKRLEAAQQQGMADAVYAAANQAASKDTALKMKRMEDEKNAYVIGEGERLQALSLKAQEKVDPEAAKGSSGAQLMAAIGVALGAFGASINGGQNTALQIVNANIDRNIKAQETNINNASRTLAQQESLYKQNLEAFGDRERAVLATKVQYLDQVKAMGDAQYAMAKHTMNEADKHTWDQHLMEQSAEYKTKFAELTADKHETQGNEHFIPGQTVGGAPAAKPLPNVIALSDGTHVQMPNEKQMEKAADKITTISQLQDMSTRALAIRKKMEKLSPILDRTAYETEYKTLQDMEQEKIALLSTERGQGTVRDNEYARAMATQSFFTSGLGLKNALNPVAGSDRKVADENLKRQIQRGDNEQRIIAKANGGNIVKTGFARDANGQLQPVGSYTGQQLRPDERLPPKGFVPMDSRNPAVTAAEPLGDTTPMAPIFDGTAGATSTAGGKSKKGDGVHMKKMKK